MRPARPRMTGPVIPTFQRSTKAKKANTRTMTITRQLQYGPQPSMRRCHLSRKAASSSMRTGWGAATDQSVFIEMF